MPAEDGISRRRFLTAPLWGVAFLPFSRTARGQSGPQDTAVGRLSDPRVAGKPRPRVTDYENDPLIVGIEGKIRCTCGCNLSVYTCRTTDFTCEVSPAMHREVIALVEEGKTAEEILAAFVQRYGEAVLMAPPKRGFNWAAYLVPGAAILVCGVLLAWYLKRRVGIARAGGTEGREEAPAAVAEIDSERARKLAAELEKLEL
jgi:cytochrome c-type biogenesis protein CcmH